MKHIRYVFVLVTQFSKNMKQYLFPYILAMNDLLRMMFCDLTSANLFYF